VDASNHVLPAPEQPDPDRSLPAQETFPDESSDSDSCSYVSASFIVGDDDTLWWDEADKGGDRGALIAGLGEETLLEEPKVDLYELGLAASRRGEITYRNSRIKETNSNGKEDFEARLYCVRVATQVMLEDASLRSWMAVEGKKVGIRECLKFRSTFVDFFGGCGCSKEDPHSRLGDDTAPRACVRAN
jgi:hypothetical protein